MTTEATPGSATAAQPDAGIPAATTGAGDKGQTTNGAVDPFAGLQDAGIREWVGKAGFKDTSATSFEALAKKTRDAESLIGKSVQLPAADAKPEDWDKFYGKLGRPEKPDGYEFKLPEGLPENLPYNTELRDRFSPVAHKLGLSKSQAAGLHDWMAQEGAAQFKADGEAMVKRSLDTTTALEQKWGGPKDSDAFKAKLVAAETTIRLGKLEAPLKEAGLLGPGNLVLHPEIADLLARASVLFKEDSLVSGTATVTGDNPFTGNNVTEQNLMWNKDRQKAEAMIRAIGKTPADFGFRA